MRRTLFTLAAALSLLSCAATAVLWARTASFAGMWSAGSGASVFAMAYSYRGGVMLGIDTFGNSRRTARAVVRHWQLRKLQTSEEKRRMLELGYVPPPVWFSKEFKARGAINGEIHLGLIVPHWFLILLLSSVSLACWRLSHRRRMPAGLCSTCGYDLRATPERCPECGHVREKTNA